MIRVGGYIRIGVRSDGTPELAQVVFMHPANRFIVIERTVPHGHTVRETRFIGRRRGRTQPTGS